MKKVLVFLVIFAMSLSAVFADELRLEKESQYQRKVMEIGYRILNANGIEKRMTFYYNPVKDVNAVSYASSKQIQVYKGLLPFIDNDDELAAVMSHEIAHGLDFHKGYWRRMGMAFKTRSYEKKADLRGVDLMVNAGYNPVAMIVVLNKITGEPNWFEVSSHPVGSERLASVYEHIYAKYPAYLADNEYKNNLYYQNFLLTSKEQRKIIKEKYAPAKVVPVSNKKKNREK